MPDVDWRILKQLEPYADSFKVHRHSDLPAPITNPADFAAALGYDINRIAKTLLLRSQSRFDYYAVTLRAAVRADLTGIAQSAASGRLEVASPREMLDATGYLPRGMSPLGITGISVFLDQSLLNYDTVLIGGGVPGVEIEIPPRLLASLCNATVGQFT